MTLRLATGLAATLATTGEPARKADMVLALGGGCGRVRKEWMAARNRNRRRGFFCFSRLRKATWPHERDVSLLAPIFEGTLFRDGRHGWEHSFRAHTKKPSLFVSPPSPSLIVITHASAHVHHSLHYQTLASTASTTRPPDDSTRSLSSRARARHTPKASPKTNNARR